MLTGVMYWHHWSLVIVENQCTFWRYKSICKWWTLRSAVESDRISFAVDFEEKLIRFNFVADLKVHHLKTDFDLQKKFVDFWQWPMTNSDQQWPVHLIATDNFVNTLNKETKRNFTMHVRVYVSSKPLRRNNVIFRCYLELGHIRVKVATENDVTTCINCGAHEDVVVFEASTRLSTYVQALWCMQLFLIKEITTCFIISTQFITLCAYLA